MGNQVKITVMLDDNIIQGVKVNDFLFFKHEDETEVDFYNKRIIPLLREKGINFIRHYNYGYVDVMEEKDYVISDADIVVIDKKQIGNILTTNNQRDLHYDEQLYLTRLYEKRLNEDYDYVNCTTFQEAQNQVLLAMCEDFYGNVFEEVLKEYFNEEDCERIKRRQTVWIIDDNTFYMWSSSDIKSVLYEIRREKDILNKQVEEKLVNEQQLLNPKSYMNNCRDDVLSGKQILLQESSYNIGNMYGASNVGKRRTNQEDSYVMLEHPQNKDFKLLAVADGMGKYSSGEIVSNHTVKKLIEWFESQDSSIMNNMEQLKVSIDKFLPNIFDDLIEKEGDTTLVTAIVGKEETLIVNIGDSRIYTMKNGKMKQETKDQSLSQRQYEKGEIDEDVMRFYYKNNVAANGVRYNTIHGGADYKIISNQTYDKILLVSDGVTDCLSKDQISRLMAASKKEKLADNIVEAALNTDSVLPKEYMDNELYVHRISGGKDNTTAVYYQPDDVSQFKNR